MKNNFFEIFTIIILLIFTSINFVWKLDFKYFFTDEILYAQAGNEILSGDFTQNRQVPIIGKLIAGVAFKNFGHNVFLIRLPFALIAVFSAFIIFLILKEHFDNFTGYLGVLFFNFFPFTFETSRMSLLESPMHLFMLISCYFFLKFQKKAKVKHLFYSAIFLGVSMSVKFTVIVIFFVMCLFLIKNIKNLIMFIFTFLAIFSLSYLPMILSEGYMAPIFVARSIKDTYLQRNIEGKNGEYSSQTLYLDEIKLNYPSFLIIFCVFSVILFIVKPDKYSFFWFLCLAFVIVFYQVLTLKNARYISTMEIPILFLICSFIHYYKKTKLVFYTAIFAILVLGYISFLRINTLEPDKYNALYIYFKKIDRLYDSRVLLTGSFRSLKWYFGDIENKGLVIKKDFENIFEELPTFDYIAIDNQEISKNPDTTLKRFLGQNKEYYTQSNVGGLSLYTKKEGVSPPLRR